MTSKHTDDDRWLAALAGQAEPDDAQTSQAASLRRYLELQDEREAPLERKAAGRMARRLQAGLAAAQASHTDEATSTGSASQPWPAAQAAPSGGSSASSWWSRGWAWCFPPLQGNGGHYAAAGALAVAVFTGVLLAPSWFSGADDPAASSAPAADERVALAAPARRFEPTVAAPDLASATLPARNETTEAASVAAPTSATASGGTSAVASATTSAATSAPTPASTQAEASRKPMDMIAAKRMVIAQATAQSAARDAEPGTVLGAADIGARITAMPDAKIESKTAARAAAMATAPQADAVTPRTDIGSVRGLVSPRASAAPAAVANSVPTKAAPAAVTTGAATAVMAAPPAAVAAAPTAASNANGTASGTAGTGGTAATAATAATTVATAASATAPRQRLSVPQPADAAAQLEELLRQQDITYALRITPGVWLLDADVPEAKRPVLIEPLRKFRLELPTDGKLRVRITPAR